MIRKTLFAVAVSAAAAALAVAGLPTGTVAQEAGADEDAAAAPGGVASLILGDRYEGAGWTFEAQDVFVDAADRVAWSEVRIAVALRNDGPAPLPYSSSAFFDGTGYPRLQLVDAFDVTRPYRMLRPGQDAIPTSNVTMIPPGLTGHWTVGFAVPTVNVDSMRLVLVEPPLGAVAEWDLTSAPVVAGWSPPPLETVAVGDVVEWGGDGLLAAPVRYGSLICGDPDNELVTQVFALQMDVTNANFTDDVAFPGIRLPDTAAIAQWADGSTAQMSYETFGGVTETLRKFAGDLVFIPPTDGEFFPRGLLFGVTQDSRVGGVDAGPQGVQLNRPDGTSVWLALDGPGELAVNPRFCDRGLFAGPLALSYTPAGALDIGAQDVAAVTADELDAQTGEVMIQAVVVVGEAAARFDQDFTGLTAADLNAVWPQLTFVDGLIQASPGVIGTDVLGPTELLMMTLSPTGRYFCAGFDIDAPVRLADGEDFDSTLNACLPIDLSAAEQAAEDDAAATTTTTSTSTTTTTTAP